MNMTTSLVRIGIALLSCFALLAGFGACSQDRLPRLRLSLSPVDSTDSILYLIYEGRDTVWVDSMLITDGVPIELMPDTQGMHSIMLAHAGYTQAYRYELCEGLWQEVPMSYQAARVDSLDSLEVMNMAGLDAGGKYTDMYQLQRKGAVALIFSSLELSTHRRAERDSLLRSYPTDSLTLVYLMLTSSDSAALARLKRDSLDKKSVAYSDSLGLVSRMRRVCGIERRVEPAIFVVDTLGRIKPYSVDALKP